MPINNSDPLQTSITQPAVPGGGFNPSQHPIRSFLADLLAAGGGGMSTEQAYALRQQGMPYAHSGMTTEELQQMIAIPQMQYQQAAAKALTARAKSSTEKADESSRKQKILNDYLEKGQLDPNDIPKLVAAAKSLKPSDQELAQNPKSAVEWNRTANALTKALMKSIGTDTGKEKDDSQSQDQSQDNKSNSSDRVKVTSPDGKHGDISNKKEVIDEALANGYKLGWL